MEVLWGTEPRDHVWSLSAASLSFAGEGSHVAPLPKASWGSASAAHTLSSASGLCHRLCRLCPPKKAGPGLSIRPRADALSCPTMQETPAGISVPQCPPGLQEPSGAPVLSTAHAPADPPQVSSCGRPGSQVLAHLYGFEFSCRFLQHLSPWVLELSTDI